MRDHQDVVQARLHGAFMHLGHRVASFPLSTILLSLCATLTCATGLLAGKWEARLEWSYVPRELPAFKTYVEQLELFGPPPRVAEFKAEAIDGDANMLELDKLRAALRVHDGVWRVRAPNVAEPGRSVRLADVCQRAYPTGPCAMDNGLARTALDQRRDELDAGTIPRAEIEHIVFASHRSLSLYFGGVRADRDTARAQVRVLRFFYLLDQPALAPQPLLGAPNAELSAAREWEAAFLRYTASAATSDEQRQAGVRVTSIAARSLDDEVARNVQGSLTFMVVAVASILLYMALLLGGRPPINSRLLLGAGAVSTILLSALAGFGIVALCGVPLTDVSMMVVFIVVGIGVDDVIVIVDLLRAQPASAPAEERVAHALGTAGATIFVTSLTDFVAFCVAATVDFPGVRWFCIVAAVIVALLFALTVSFFTALLVLDERRLAARRLDCLPCVRAARSDAPSAPPEALAVVEAGANGTGQAPKPSPRTEQPRAQFGENAVALYARGITSRPIALLVVLAFLSTIPLGFWVAVPAIAVGAPFEDAVPDGSPLAAYHAHTEEFFEPSVEGVLLFDGVDWTDPHEQGAVEVLLASYAERVGPRQADDTRDGAAAPVLTAGFDSWLADFKTWARAHGRRTSGSGFYDGLHEWLGIDEPVCADAMCSRVVVPRAYHRDILWSDDGGARGAERTIGRTRLRCRVHSPDNLRGRIAVMEAYQAHAAAHSGRLGTRVTPWAYVFIYSERDRILVRLIATTLLLAAAAVLGVLLFFLHPLTVALIGAGLGAIDACLFGMMALWGVPLDISAFICLAISIGLSVDYVVHIAYAFEHASGAAAVRMHTALREMGLSVGKGGLSTFLGIAVLVGSESEVFRIFFKMLLSTVVLGLLTGLVYFPAAAALVGHLVPPRRVAGTAAAHRAAQ